MKTRNGIYYDLSESHYRHKMRDTGITFVFSSDLHLYKFEESYEKNRVEVNTTFKARYGINFTLTTLPDIMLYKKIESRGFLVLDVGGNQLWRENHQLNGETLTAKN